MPPPVLAVWPHCLPRREGHRVCPVDIVTADEIGDHGAVVLAPSGELADVVAALAVEMWERRSPLMVLRQRWPGDHEHRWQVPFPCSVIADLDERAFAAASAFMLDGFGTNGADLSVADVVDAGGAHVTWLRGDARAGVLLPRLRKMVLGRPTARALVRVPEAEHDHWARVLDVDDEVAGIELIGPEPCRSDHATGMVFESVGALPDPREHHRLRRRDIPPDPRPFDGSLVPPRTIEDVAHAIAAVALALPDDDSEPLLSAILSAADREPGFEVTEDEKSSHGGSDREVRAAVLTDRVFRLLGRRGAAADPER